ncbi:MAG: GTP 3',8-cyclase MoaA [Polyangiales bacterium]|nr:GTP 3',8-cyclase MoaA [Myxococcales bacterium]
MRLPVIAVEGSRSALREALPEVPTAFGADGVPLLADARGRAYSYLRLSVTDRCDLACVYCMPPSGEEDHAVHAELLSFEEVVRVVDVFTRMGVRRVRLTGGEPLVRKDIVRLVEMVAANSRVEDLVLTTNATRLAELATPLRLAGLRGVNVSLDTLEHDRFERITRGGELTRVLAGVHAALRAGLHVKLNTVPLRGENDDELGAIVDWAWSLGITPRFIELMPLGEGAAIHDERFMAVEDVRASLGARLEAAPLLREGMHKGPARYAAAANGSGRRVGFISAISGNFCDDCNRIRVTARGDIRACLATRRAVSLRDVLRSGGDERDLAWAIHWSLLGKDAGHHFLERAVREHTHVGMSLIGG